MKRFAELLDRLAYEPGRNNKLRLMTEYFRITPDPERGWALAALTGALSFQYANPNIIRALIWPGLSPPYLELFAWLEGRAEKPVTRDPVPFRPAMLAHAVEQADLTSLDPADYMAEWKWDGIRVQASAGTDELGNRLARLY